MGTTNFQPLQMDNDDYWYYSERLLSMHNGLNACKAHFYAFEEETEMKKLLIIGCTLVSVLGVGSNVLGFQEVIAIVTNSHMDQGNQLCTITIDRSHHTTNRTTQCQNRAFSWRCFHDDYRFELAGQSRNNRRPIQIRYSEYRCEDRTRNMLLLTVW